MRTQSDDNFQYHQLYNFQSLATKSTTTNEEALRRVRFKFENLQAEGTDLSCVL